jgi:hypothetical protein
MALSKRPKLFVVPRGANSKNAAYSALSDPAQDGFFLATGMRLESRNRRMFVTRELGQFDSPRPPSVTACLRPLPEPTG